MPYPTTHPAPSRRARLAPACAAVAALLACGLARADDGVDPCDDIAPETVDAAVAAAALPGLSALERSDPLATTVVLATRLDTSAAAIGDAVRPTVTPLVKPTPKTPTSVASRPIHVDKASVDDAARLLTIDDQTIAWHADGLPAPNAPSPDPAERVLPRQVDPNAVAFGAHWGAADTLDMPLGTSIALMAQADILTGAAGLRANSVRRSLRLTAQWDNNLDSMVLGLTPGVEHALGSIYERQVTGLQASTLDPQRTARWSSFVEVSGEKISPTNLYDNATAQVRAGATWQTTRDMQVDLSVSRGTMDKPDTQGNVGVSMKF